MDDKIVRINSRSNKDNINYDIDADARLEVINYIEEVHNSDIVFSREMFFDKSICMYRMENIFYKCLERLLNIDLNEFNNKEIIYRNNKIIQIIEQMYVVTRRNGVCLLLEIHKRKDNLSKEIFVSQTGALKKILRRISNNIICYYYFTKIKGEKKAKKMCFFDYFLDNYTLEEYSMAHPIFDPERKPLLVSKTNGGGFNLWQGFTVNKLNEKNIENDEQVKLYLNHMKEVICNNNNDDYEFLVNYLAHMFQKPYEKSQKGIILKSGQGTGKGLFLRPLVTIAGYHGTSVAAANDTAGKFNSLIAGKVLVFFDEAFAGSTKSSDRLKLIITEPDMRIEYKGLDSISVDNYMRLFLATNHDYFVNLEIDDRRYLICEVSEKYKTNKDYFKKLKFLRKNDKDHVNFCEKIFTYFCNIDISNFDIETSPRNKAHFEQKINSSGPVIKWIYDFLIDEKLIFDDMNESSYWPLEVESREVIKSCIKYIKENNYSDNHINSNVIIRELSKFGTKRGKKYFNKKQARTIIFPLLEDFRKAFSDKLQSDIDWSY